MLSILTPNDWGSYKNVFYDLKFTVFDLMEAEIRARVASVTQYHQHHYQGML